jgi:hypothetical protein
MATPPTDRTRVRRVPQRVRRINRLPTSAVTFELLASVLTQWTPISKDGADLPESSRRLRAAQIRMGVGEAYDYLWTPGGAGTALLKVIYRDDNIATLFHTISQTIVIAQ